MILKEDHCAIVSSEELEQKVEHFTKLASTFWFVFSGCKNNKPNHV